MSAIRWVVLVAVVAMLALAVLVAQAAFRFERTVMSYRFTYGAMEQMLEPLDDPLTHARTVDEAFRAVRRETGLSVPRDLEPLVVDAVGVGFSASRLRRSANRWLITVQQVLHGRADSLVLPYSLAAFKDSLLSQAAGRFSPLEMAQIREALNQVPTTVDLADAISPEARDRFLSIGRVMGLMQIVLQYLVPGLLIVACFFHGRIGTGIAATGVAFLVAGVPSVVVVFLRADAIAASAGILVSRALPTYLAWMIPGLEASIAALIATGRTTAVLVTLYGVAAGAVGGYLIAKKGDPRIDFRAS